MEALSLMLLLFAVLPARAADNPRVPVLVELFTSEGCSSCPPADALLTELAKKQPVSGAELIILSEHVDYWNRLGWTDPFSSAEFSKRQEAYANSIAGSSVYTPQMVVDGRAEFNGSSSRQALDAITRAAKLPKATVTATATPAPEGARLEIKVDGLDAVKLSGKADVLIAITESELSTKVPRGENSGRTLPHSGVVRRLSLVGTAVKNGFFADQTLVLDKSWKRENLRAVVFVQEHGSRRVIGAASIVL